GRRRGGGAPHPRAAGLRGRQVEPVVVRPEEELDEQPAERPQQPQQGRLEREEGGRPRVTEAVGDDLIEPLMGLVSQRVGCRWTRRRGRATLTGAHGDRLRTVPVWDLLNSGQDKSPEHPPSATVADNGPPGALPDPALVRRASASPAVSRACVYAKGAAKQVAPNRIEPKWVHGKRAIIEPDRPLT